MMMALRCIVQKSRPSSNVKVKGQGHRGQKNSAAFCSGVVLRGAVLVRHFFGSGPRGRVNKQCSCVVHHFYAGGKISACCLVVSFVAFGSDK